MESDPNRILLNMTSFRGKFHIYEITQKSDKEINGTIYVVRKQLLSHASMTVMQPVRESEAHTEIQVDRDAVSQVYDMVRDLSLPASRTGHAGKDGSWFALQIGIGACSTTIRWWSDKERELEGIYKLRDTIVKTIKGIIRSADK